MSTGDDPHSNELTPGETAALLRHVLAIVDDNERKGSRKRWVEISCAFVLSLATMASAWCAYQSTLWGGVQTFRLAAANKASRKSTESVLAATELRAFDATMFIQYMQAKFQGDERQEKFLFDRFRPEMKPAVAAWLKTDPFNHPAAPPSPFKMAAYMQHELEEAKRHEDVCEREYATAQAANETSDTYVLLTVLFASVMFFGGIGGTFQSRRLRVSVFVISLLLFVATLTVLGTMPICKE